MDAANFSVSLEHILIAVSFFMTATLYVGYTRSVFRIPRFLQPQMSNDRIGRLLYELLSYEEHFVNAWGPYIIASMIHLLSFMSLILFLTGKISVDAFGVILIGLIPSLDALRRLGVLALAEYGYIAARPALYKPIQRFRYLRHGEPPNTDLPNNSDIHFLPTTYIRVPSQGFYTPLLPITCMWNGKVVRYNENVIVLRDENNFGDALIWWKAAKSGTKIIANLAELGLAHPKRIVRALELIAEMTMIGDSVLHYHEAALKEYTKSADQIRDAILTTLSSVYSRILGGIGLLDEWGTVDDAKKKRFIEEDFSKLRRGDKYGMLFFILLNMSNFFDSREEKIGEFSRTGLFFILSNKFNFIDSRNVENGEFSRTSASDVIAKFEESNEDGERKSITKMWLSQYCRDSEHLFENQDEAVESTTRNATTTSDV